LPLLFGLLTASLLGACSCSSREPDGALPAPSGHAPAVSVAPPAPAPAPAEPAAPEPGADLIAPARELYRVAACGEAGEVPERFNRAMVDAHCKTLRALYARYRERWLEVAMPFIADLRPKELSPRVVYPFGGGDLLSALAVYPDAEEITTLSLEPAGDVRRIDTILPVRLKGALATNDLNLRKLLGLSYSNTINLGRGGRAWLPGEIVLLLGALVVHGYEPTSLRYFRIHTDGMLRYLSSDEIQAESEQANPGPEGGRAPLANVELRFRKLGTSGPEKIARHLAHDLANHEVGLDPGLRKHLEAKGKVAVMTKAASHLLWADEFSTIREYLLEHAQWMISDSTGVPPRFAQAAGFVQDTFGVFDGPAPFGPIEALDGRAFRRLFAENPKRPLPFKFGYGDVHHRSHMVVMRRPVEGAAAKKD
jgi:hypothetical protein